MSDLLRAAKAVLRSALRHGSPSGQSIMDLEAAVESTEAQRDDDGVDSPEGWCAHCACQSCYDAQKRANT